MLSSIFASGLLAAISLTAGVVAQDYSAFPAACATQCGAYVKNSWLCGQQYPITNGTEAFQACFCDALPSAQVSTCAACLTAQKMTRAAGIVTNTTSLCKNYTEDCVWQCSFKVCDSADVKCQCTKDYLQEVYNCGSCNTNNKHPGTQVTDYQSLYKSCAAQNLVSPNDAAKSTDPIPSPTPTAYTAPVLTGNGLAGGSTQPAAGTTAAVLTLTKAATTPVASGNLPTTQAHVATTPSATVAVSASVIASSTMATSTGVSIGARNGSNRSREIGAGALVGLLLSIMVL